MSDLDYRTWGATQNCKGCRFWSEMLAMARGGGPVQAMCLGQGSEHAGKYTPPWNRCETWAEGSMGAIDQPGGDPYATTEPQS